MGSETAETRFVWGTEVRRRATGIPFRCYEPRRHRMADLLLDCAPWADRVHLVQGPRRLGFGEVTTAVGRVAAAFAAAGVTAGDRILMLADNSPEWVVAFWAGSRLGAVVALGNAWWSAAEVEHALRLVSPVLVVCDPARRNLLPPDLPADRTVDIDDVRIWAEHDVPAQDVPAQDVPEQDVPEQDVPEQDVPEQDVTARPAGGIEGEDEPALIVFTAGTTGAPKAVVLAHRSVISNLHGLLARAGRLPHQIDPARRAAVVLQSGPLFHIGGVQSLPLALVAGSTVVFLDGRFDAGQVLDLIEGEQVTVWGGVPTMASRVLDHPSVAGRDLTSVRSITMGGSRVPPELLARMRVAFPNARRGMSTIYGMTESGGTVASASGELMATHPETSGPPGAVVDMRIGEPDDTGTGEILVRTPAQMIGYWSAAAGGPVTVGDGPIDDDGWLRTGDLGRLDDGLLYVTGRSKDVIIRGGENIAAAHVESALTRHPDVLSAAVVGLPDADLGERVAAAVQLTPGSTTTTIELAAFVAVQLARFEVPVEWRLQTDALPTTDVGKIDKKALRESWELTS